MQACREHGVMRLMWSGVMCETDESWVDVIFVIKLRHMPLEPSSSDLSELVFPW